jgi:transposase
VLCLGRIHDNDFKLNTVKLVVEEGKPVAQVARDLGITPKTLYGWVSQYKSDPKHPFVGSGNLKPEAQAVRELERENRELKEELEILKKALRIFSKDRK